MHSRSTLHTLLFCILLGSCYSVPPGAVEELDLAKEIYVPEQWAHDNPQGTFAPDIEGLWRDFPSDFLVKLVREGLTASPSLKLSQARVEAAAIRLRAQGGAGLPSLSAGLTSSRSRVNFLGLPVPGGSGVLSSQTTSHALSIGTSWEIDLWGRLASRQRAAEYDLRAEELDQLHAEQSHAAQILKGVFKLAATEAMLRVQMQEVEVAGSALANARRMSRSGTASSGVLLRSEFAFERAEQALSKSEQLRLQTESPLLVLLGRASGPGSHFSVDERSRLSQLLEQTKVPATPAPGLPSELLSRRPDLIALRQRISQSQADAEAAHAQLFPSLSLTGNLGTSGTELRNLLDGDFRNWGLGASLLAPIFNGGGLRAQEDMAIQARNSSLYVYATACLQAFAEVDSLLGTEHGLRAEKLHSNKSGEITERLLKLAQSQHQRGSGNAAAVFAAQSEAHQSRLQSLALQRDILINHINLYLALGGTFATSDPGPKE